MRAGCKIAEIFSPDESYICYGNNNIIMIVMCVRGLTSNICSDYEPWLTRSRLSTVATHISLYYDTDHAA